VNVVAAAAADVAAIQLLPLLAGSCYLAVIIRTNAPKMHQCYLALLKMLLFGAFGC
jgi:hypothetical protein